ncbi:MAG TPA: hypothetical protein VGI10_24460 [Polyangiaceae bacterium]
MKLGAWSWFCAVLGSALLAGCGGSTEKPRPTEDPVAKACVPITLTGADDTGGEEPDCNALQYYELSEIEYFRNGAATGWYINADRTAVMEPPPDTDPVPAEEIPGGLCLGQSDQSSRFAMHMRSGIFSDFGATFGSNLRRRTIDPPAVCPVTPCPAREIAPPPVGPCGVGQGVPGQGAALNGQCQTGQDVSAWQGIVFWARVGPESANAVRVQVGDSRTDDSNQACVCTSFVDQNDSSNGCDKYGSFVTLDGTWRPYLVPFAGMQQGGWGISDPQLDTTQLFSLAINFSRDQWDVWISHIAFYRSAP